MEDINRIEKYTFIICIWVELFIDWIKSKWIRRN